MADANRPGSEQAGGQIVDVPMIQADGSESMEGMFVTSDYFRVMGLQPVLGRAFLDSEAGRDARPVVILGYD